MECSLKEFLQGFRRFHRPHLTQRTSFLIHPRQAQTATEAPLLNFDLPKSSTGYPRMANPALTSSQTTGYASLRIATDSPSAQPALPVGNSPFLWENAATCAWLRLTRSGCSQLDGSVSQTIQPCRWMIPRSVRPFTKNCIASATSSKPMILTRIRMPVSPITVRTLPAAASTQ
jgi:hypothetical protein